MNLPSLIGMLATAAFAQDTTPLSPRADGKIPIFVGDSEMFQSSSFAGVGATRSAAHGVGMSQSGTLKFTVAIMKELDARCKTVIVVNRPDIAQFFIRFDMSGVFIYHGDMAVFNRAGEMVFVTSSTKVKNDVRRFCESPVFGFPAKIKKPGVFAHKQVD